MANNIQLGLSWRILLLVSTHTSTSLSRQSAPTQWHDLPASLLLSHTSRSLLNPANKSFSFASENTDVLERSMDVFSLFIRDISVDRRGIHFSREEGRVQFAYSVFGERNYLLSWMTCCCCHYWTENASVVLPFMTQSIDRPDDREAEETLVFHKTFIKTREKGHLSAQTLLLLKTH